MLPSLPPSRVVDRMGFDRPSAPCPGRFRDPGAPKGTNLSNGLRLTLCD